MTSSLCCLVRWFRNQEPEQTPISALWRPLGGFSRQAPSSQTTSPPFSCGICKEFVKRRWKRSSIETLLRIPHTLGCCSLQSESSLRCRTIRSHKKVRPLHAGEAVFKKSNANQQGTELHLPVEAVTMPLAAIMMVPAAIVASIVPVAVVAASVPIPMTIEVVAIEAADKGPAARNPISAIPIASNPGVSRAGAGWHVGCRSAANVNAKLCSVRIRGAKAGCAGQDCRSQHQTLHACHMPPIPAGCLRSGPAHFRLRLGSCCLAACRLCPV